MKNCKQWDSQEGPWVHPARAEENTQARDAPSVTNTIYRHGDLDDAVLLEELHEALAANVVGKVAHVHLGLVPQIPCCLLDCIL